MSKRLLISTLVLLTACGNPGSEGPIKSAGNQDICASRDGVKLGGPFDLVDHTGKAVTQDDYKGKPSLVFFGFTQCNTVCPPNLVRINLAVEMLPDTVQKPRTIFVSVDPEHDTPETMALYLTNNGFPKDMVGLTGTNEQVANAAKAFKVFYSKVKDDTSAAGYQYNHGTFTYLMDENWDPVIFFMHNDSPEEMAACMAKKLPKAEG